MYNKQASPPKGNKKLPGAKGPGDPKVENRTKKAQQKSAREIKVHVSASAISHDIQAGATNRIETQFGLASLSCMGMGPKAGTMTPTMPHKAPSTGNNRMNIQSKHVKAGPSSLSDKVGVNEDPQNEVAYNPGMKAQGKCKTCGKKMSACTCMKARGHSLGAKKGWCTRNKGHLSKVEKTAHYSTMK